jgi:methylated-DNA-[protein]-cysteine S-methyltransferase
MSLRHTTIESVIGELTLLAEGDKLTGVYFPHHWHPPVAVGPFVADDPVFTRAGAELAEYLDGRRTTFDLPTATAGDDFQERVWAMLAEIPYGGTTSYGALAGRLGDPALAQRVGQAVGHNPLSIVVPCHRVVGANGRLTGYAGGLRRKQFLLDLEEPAGAKAERRF